MQCCLRLVRLADLGQRHAQVKVRGTLARVQGNNLLQTLDGIVAAPLAKQSRTQLAQRFRDIRLCIERPPQLGFGILELLYPNKRRAEQDAHQEVAGLFLERHAAEFDGRPGIAGLESCQRLVEGDLP